METRGEVGVIGEKSQKSKVVKSKVNSSSEFLAPSEDFFKHIRRAIKIEFSTSFMGLLLEEGV